jgi:predicted secreted hydrolase
MSRGTGSTGRVVSGPSARSALARLATIALAVVVAGCANPILANRPAERALGPSPTPGRPAASDPVPIQLPADDAPHDRLTEWWYYTGHLVDGSGGRYGFEVVVFRAERGSFPVSWASHLAITDETGGAFHYAERSEVGPGVDRSAALAAPGFDLSLGPAGSPWSMTGGDGHDRLAAVTSADEASKAGWPGGFGLELSLVAAKPAVLHDNDGWIDFGSAGGSYYYSRTSLTATGRLTVAGRTVDVTGSAWFDHQWGDFIAVGGGGWDWFAVNLADGTDLTLSLVRAADGSYPLVYGTLVDATGRARHLDRTAFSVTALGRWRSPTTGADYPSGWLVKLPGEALEITLMPTVLDQELDTRASTGVVYWEGSQVVRATRAGASLGGEAYVELTGYGP